MGNKLVEGLSRVTRKIEKVCSGVYLLDLRVVNAYIIRIDERHWILVDTGLENSEDFIVDSAKQVIGCEIPPDAILLTHGHFDHVGSVKALTQRWQAPVYIHKNELPYVTGRKDYPLPDDEAGKGLVSRMSESFPHSSIDVEAYARMLPENNAVPFADGWRWIFTPGHTAGHVSYIREADKVLIAGDAISTVRQESLWSVITQSEEICGPPSYLTEDFDLARESIDRLVSLHPSLLLPSHGRPIEGNRIQTSSIEVHS